MSGFVACVWCPDKILIVLCMRSGQSGYAFSGSRQFWIQGCAAADAHIGYREYDMSMLLLLLLLLPKLCLFACLLMVALLNLLLLALIHAPTEGISCIRMTCLSEASFFTAGAPLKEPRKTNLGVLCMKAQ